MNKDKLPVGAIKKLTLRDRIREVPNAWRDQYSEGYFAKDPAKQNIQASLDVLDLETCSADDVNGIIGNSSWTGLECDLCGEEEDPLLRLGQEPDYDSRWLDICLPCLQCLGEFAISETQENKHD